MIAVPFACARDDTMLRPLCRAYEVLLSITCGPKRYVTVYVAVSRFVFS